MLLGIWKFLAFLNELSCPWKSPTGRASPRFPTCCSAPVWGCGVPRYGMARHGTAQHGVSARHGTAWHRVPWAGGRCSAPGILEIWGVPCQCPPWGPHTVHGAARGLATGHPLPRGGGCKGAPSPPKHPQDPHDAPVHPRGQGRLSQHRVLRPILTPII